ncbi:pleckstrin homology domain-containing family F member 2-like [Carassius auratus]|uniref:Pleckstrin homology domain-containing family F member 2-like n=1 Tax=Carassius auratus TaxID=7957 RepID=A0A6P6PRF4_CARAU|nr:pleckstrin homology domain-containing family F member 2-like [Carassius auratus]XP_052416292.1 pleckstrin homology domain-containing family F member 1 [Carassius gibelio]
MVEQQIFTVQNRERIQAVESTFGRPGKMLLKPGRILVGEGYLSKLCRRGPKPKAFFLFNDILVYGRIMVPGRWNSRQKIIPLEDVQQEDLEDGVAMPNQWLIRTPRKSFYVSAASPDEKNAWMGRIEQYRSLLMQAKGLPADKAVENFAATWIPDMASAICMRCSKRFNVANRRHHCRRCGYIVCRACSKSRALIPNISSRPVRICRVCVSSVHEGKEQGKQRAQGKHWKKNSVEDTTTLHEYETSSDDESCEEGYQVSTKWFKSPEDEDYSPYCYIKPEHMNPPVSGL